MTEYKLIESASPEALSSMVNTYLKKDWILYGNPITKEYCFAQALIKKIQINPPIPTQDTGGITKPVTWW